MDGLKSHPHVESTRPSVRGICLSRFGHAAESTEILVDYFGTQAVTEYTPEPYGFMGPSEQQSVFTNVKVAK